jgi:hypothetical protein
VILHLLLTKKSMKLCYEISTITIWRCRVQTINTLCPYSIKLVMIGTNIWNEKNHMNTTFNNKWIYKKISKLVKKSRSSIYLPPLVLHFFQCLGSLGNSLVTTFLSCKLTFLCCMIINTKSIVGALFDFKAHDLTNVLNSFSIVILLQ